MLERLRDAVNAHDAQRLASLFAEDYRSAQPLHPSRGFGGSAQVLENWLSVFDGVTDVVRLALRDHGARWVVVLSGLLHQLIPRGRYNFLQPRNKLLVDRARTAQDVDHF